MRNKQKVDNSAHIDSLAINEDELCTENVKKTTLEIQKIKTSKQKRTIN